MSAFGIYCREINIKMENNVQKLENVTIKNKKEPHTPASKVKLKNQGRNRNIPVPL